MAEAVVDDLESIEVEVQRREPASAVPLEFFESLTEPLHKHRTVVQPGQWIPETKAAQQIHGRGTFGDIGQ